MPRQLAEPASEGTLTAVPSAFVAPHDALEDEAIRRLVRHVTWAPPAPVRATLTGSRPEAFDASVTAATPRTSAVPEPPLILLALAALGTVRLIRVPPLE